jgi:hypothetical protein
MYYGADRVGVFVLVGDSTDIRVFVAVRDGPEIGVGVDMPLPVGVDVTSIGDVGVTVCVKQLVGVTVQFMVAVGVFFRLSGFFRGLHGFREGRVTCRYSSREISCRFCNHIKKRSFLVPHVTVMRQMSL